MRTLLLTTTSLLLAAPALAQETEVITVTSTVLQTGADEITGSVEIIDRSHSEESLSCSLADPIAHEPGVSTTYFGPAASRPVIRGLGADRVRVLNNGVGLIDASTSSPDHAVASEALEAEDKPFFLYLAYNAPHWPLNSKWQEFLKYKGKLWQMQ